MGECRQPVGAAAWPRFAPGDGAPTSNYQVMSSHKTASAVLLVHERFGASSRSTNRRPPRASKGPRTAAATTNDSRDSRDRARPDLALVPGSARPVPGHAPCSRAPQEQTETSTRVHHHTWDRPAARPPSDDGLRTDCGNGYNGSHSSAWCVSCLTQLQRGGCFAFTPNTADVTSVRARFSASVVGARRRRVSTSHTQPLTVTSFGISG
jgi:hypothetical protein